MREFYACYLLQSKKENGKGKTYIGFTVNPKRRIRQHNGEISAGALKTKSGRPWSMVLVVYGFPTKVQALQFEWAWQHPEKSLAVREAVAALKGTIKPAGLTGAKGKLRLLMLLLGSEQWRYFPLAMQFLSSEFAPLLHGLPLPPSHVSITIAPPEDLPVMVDDDFDEGPILDNGSEANDIAQSLQDAEDSLQNEEVGFEGAAAATAAAGEVEAEGKASCCVVCGKKSVLRWLECACGARTHVECLAQRYIQEDPQRPAVPQEGSCPVCGLRSSWVDVLARGRSAGWAQNRPRGRKRAPLKADPKMKHKEAGAAKLLAGASDGEARCSVGAADSAGAPAEPQERQEAAARGTSRRGGGGRGRTGRGRKGAPAVAIAAAAAGAVEDGSATATAAAPATRRPARGRRRAGVCAALPPDSGARRAGGIACSSGSSPAMRASRFSTSAPPSAAAVMLPSGSPAGRDLGSSRADIDIAEMEPLSPQPWNYDCSAHVLDGAPHDSPSADAPLTAGCPESPDRGSQGRLHHGNHSRTFGEQHLHPEDDAWCYLGVSPEHQSPSLPSAERSVDRGSPGALSPVNHLKGSALGKDMLPEPVCIISESDSEGSPLSSEVGERHTFTCATGSLQQQPDLNTHKRIRSNQKQRLGSRAAPQKSPRVVAAASPSGCQLGTPRCRGYPGFPRGSSAVLSLIDSRPVGAAAATGGNDCESSLDLSPCSTRTAEALLGTGATPVSAWMASKLRLGSGEMVGCSQGPREMAGPAVDSPMVVSSPTPRRRRLAFLAAPAPAGRAAAASEDDVIVIE